MQESGDKVSHDTSRVNYPWHQNTWQHFINARVQNQLPHAILLAGEEGIGKLMLAQRMAKSLICINTVDAASDACNQCQACKTFESGANPDFTQINLLEDKQQISVDQIRSLSEFLNYSRSYNTNRVVIINPAERMNINAANSLLKSLEEPSAHTVIILVTAKSSTLLATIKSRCQLFNLVSPSKDQSISWLQQHQKLNNTNEGELIDPETLLSMVGNKPLKAINVNRKDVDDRKQFFQDLLSVINQQTALTDIAKKWEKYDCETLLNWQLSYIQKYLKSTLNTTTSDQDIPSTKIKLTTHLSTEERWHLYQNLIQQKQFIHTSVNSLMFLENMIMLWMKKN